MNAAACLGGGRREDEGKPNHYLDTIVGAFAIADMKNYRGLATREVRSVPHE